MELKWGLGDTPSTEAVVRRPVRQGVCDQLVCVVQGCALRLPDAPEESAADDAVVAGVSSIHLGNFEALVAYIHEATPATNAPLPMSRARIRRNGLASTP